MLEATPRFSKLPTARRGEPDRQKTNACEGWIVLSKQAAWRIFHRFFGTIREPSIFHPQWLFVREYLRVVKAQRALVRGRVLDIGSGDRFFERLFAGCYTRYVGLEFPSTGALVPGGNAPDVAGDGCHLPFGPETFDTVLLFEVLEHCPEPAQMLDQARAVLKHNGTLIATVPLTIPEHLAPHDYYRYTQYGLRHLFTRAQFSVERLVPICSLGGIIAYHVNYFLLEGTFTKQAALVRAIKIVGAPLIAGIWVATNLFGWCLDRILPKEGFAMNYCIIGRKG